MPEELRTQTPDSWTGREVLSKVAGLYDPMGLATPEKQSRVILV